MSESNQSGSVERVGSVLEAVEGLPAGTGSYVVMVFEMAPLGGVHHGAMFKRGGWALAGGQVRYVEEVKSEGLLVGAREMAVRLLDKVVKWEGNERVRRTLEEKAAREKGEEEDAETRRGGEGERENQDSVQPAGVGSDDGARCEETVMEADAVEGVVRESPEVGGGLPVAQSGEERGKGKGEREKEAVPAEENGEVGER
jgi:hypothetical protein